MNLRDRLAEAEEIVDWTAHAVGCSNLLVYRQDETCLEAGKGKRDLCLSCRARAFLDREEADGDVG